MYYVVLSYLAACGEYLHRQHAVMDDYQYLNMHHVDVYGAFEVCIVV